MALPPPLTWRNVNNGDATQKAILENMQKLGAAKQDVQMFEAPNVGGPLGMAGSGLTQMANALLGPEARRTAASNADLAKQREDLAMQSKLEEMMYGRSRDALADERAVAAHNLNLGIAEQNAKDAAAGRAIQQGQLGLQQSKWNTELAQIAKAEQAKQNQYEAQRTAQSFLEGLTGQLSQKPNELRTALEPFLNSGQVTVDQSGTLVPNMEFFNSTQGGIASAVDSMGKPTQAVNGPMMNARNDIALDNTLKSNPEYAKARELVDTFNALNPTQSKLVEDNISAYDALYKASISNADPSDDLPPTSTMRASGVTAMTDAAASPALQAPALTAANAKIQRDVDKEVAGIMAKYPGVRETQNFMQDYSDRTKYPQGATLGILSAMVDKKNIGAAYASIVEEVQSKISKTPASLDTWKGMSAEEQDMFVAKLIQGYGVDTGGWSPGWEVDEGIEAIPDELAKFRTYKEAQAEIKKAQGKAKSRQDANEVFALAGKTKF